MGKATNIVRMDWLKNRTPTGRRSATKARKLAHYFALGRGRAKEQALRPQRGAWLDQAGRPCRHEEAMQWVREQGLSHEMTYQFILSVKETELTAEAFNRAMAAGGPLFDEWRLIQHTDTRYSHAHALAFGDKPVRVKSAAFQSWWQAVRQALAQEQERVITIQHGALEQEPADERQLRRKQIQQEAEQVEPQAGLVQETTAEQAPEQSWGMEL